MELEKVKGQMQSLAMGQAMGKAAEDYKRVRAREAISGVLLHAGSRTPSRAALCAWGGVQASDAARCPARAAAGVGGGPGGGSGGPQLRAG